MKSVRTALVFAFSSLLLAAFTPDARAQVVISQVYGGAGCGTAGCSTYKNDYIELFNRGTTSQSLPAKGTYSGVAFTAPGDSDPGDDSTRFAFTVEDSSLYRTGTMREWADGLDLAGHVKAVKSKPFATEFKVNLFVPHVLNQTITRLRLVCNLPIERLAVFGSKLKTDTLCTASIVPDVKRKIWMIDFACPTLPEFTGGDQIQIDIRGLGAKPPTIQYQWRNPGDVTLVKGKVPNDQTDPRNAIKDVIYRWPMPNLHNAGTELFTFKNAFSAEGGLLIGEAKPESVKTLAWVLHKKYSNVQQSLNKRGLHHAGGPTSFTVYTTTRPMKGKLASLPPDKQNNELFAQTVALGMNLASSDFGQMPPGLGDLLIGYPAGPYADTAWFQASGLCYDSLLDGMSIRTFYNAARKWLTDKGRHWNGHTPGLCPPGTLGDALLHIARDINGAFSGPMDTLGWSGIKVRLKGVRSPAAVPYLRSNPNIPVPLPLTAEVNPAAMLPSAFELRQNYPNPFNPLTTMSFTIGHSSLVSLKVYDVLGREVATLLNHELMDEGDQEVQFDASALASGVYFYRIATEPVNDGETDDPGTGFTAVRKMILLR